jgi:hypothetical protein
MAAENQESTTLRFGNIFCIQSYATSLYIDQQHATQTHLAKIAKNDGSIQDGGSKSVFLA